MMDQPLGILGTPHVGFFALIIIGGLAGWIAGKIMNFRQGLFTNVLIGICGSFVGSKAAEIANIVVAGRLGQFIAALVGSIAVIYVWEMIQQRRSAS